MFVAIHLEFNKLKFRFLKEADALKWFHLNES